MYFVRLHAAMMIAAPLLLSPSIGAQDVNATQQPSPQDGTAATTQPQQPDATAAQPPQKKIPKQLPPHLQRLKSFVELQQQLKKQYSLFAQQNERLQEQMQQMKQQLSEHRQQSVDALFNPLLGQMNGDRQQARLVAIQELELLQSYPPNPQVTPAVLLRLGQLYFEQDDSDHMAKMEEFSKKLEALPKGQQADDLTIPEQNFRRSIDVLEQLTNNYPSYQNLDIALYLLGICTYMQGDFEDAVDAWRQLAEQHPQSAFRDEVLFRLGDYDFDDRYFTEAAAWYSQVSDPQSPFYERALYKLAWSYYLDSKYMNAVATFMKLLDSMWPQESRRDSTMAQEAIRYIVNSFIDQEAEQLSKTTKPVKRHQKKPSKGSQVIVVERMKSYFLKRPRPYNRTIFMHLGDVMAKGAETKAAVAAYRFLLQQDPMHKDAPDLYARILQVLDESDATKESMQLRQQLVQKFGPNSKWMLQHATNEELIEKTGLWVRDVILAAAVYEHKQGNVYRDAAKTKIAYVHYEQAARLYIRYLNLYPQWPDVDQAIFYLAEVTLEMGLFGNSIRLYQQLQNWIWSTKYKKQAYMGVVFAYQQAIELQESRGKLEKLDISSLSPSEKSPQPRPIPQLRKLYIEAVDEVLRRYPDFENTADVLFYTGAIYYVYGYEQEARRRLVLVLRNYPDTQAAHAVAILFVNEEADVENWREVIALANLYASQNIGGRAKEYERIEMRARFKLAAQLIEQARVAKEAGKLSEAKEHFAEAADLYAQLLRLGAVKEYTDLALYNMAVALGEAGRSQQAIDIYKRVYREHPKSQYALPALFQVALWQEKRLDFDIASKSYLRLAKDYPKSTQAGDALLNAAVLREADGQFLGASTLFLDFATRFPKRSEAAGAYLKAAQLRAKAGDLAGQRRMLQKFINRYRSNAAKQPDVVEAMVALGDSYNTSAQQNKSKKTARNLRRRYIQTYKQAVALYKANPQAMATSTRAAYFAAKADFTLMQPDFVAYQRMKLDSKRAKKQATQLTKKGQRLAELEKVYKAFIATYKSAYWSAQALYRMGALYESLYRAMFGAPCPIEVRRIDPEFGCDEYFDALAEKAAPVEEKALQLYETARQQASNLSDPKAQQLLVQLQTALHKMRPGDYVLPATTLRYPQIDDMYASGIAAEGMVPSSGMLLYPTAGDFALFDTEKLPAAAVQKSGDDKSQAGDDVEEPQQKGDASPQQDNADSNKPQESGDAEQLQQQGDPSQQQDNADSDKPEKSGGADEPQQQDKTDNDKPQESDDGGAVKQEATKPQQPNTDQVE
ncbi:MAG: tetratricopeptide repeat protein [Myxococcota bacterium]